MTDTRGCMPGGERTESEADNWCLATAQVKNRRSYDTTSPYVLESALYFTVHAICRALSNSQAACHVMVRVLCHQNTRKAKRHSARHEDTSGSGGTAPHILHLGTTLLAGQGTGTHWIGVRWAPLLLRIWRNISLGTAENRTRNSYTCSPQRNHYTDWAIPAPCTVTV